MVKIDESTINREELEKLPRLELPSGWYLGTLGTGCFMSPPGHPSYFVQQVYTSEQDIPGQLGSPRIVLLDHVVEVVGERRATDKVLERLWLKLPYDHPRVQAYVLSVYRHYRGGYFDGGILYRYEFDAKKRTFVDHPGFRDDWREKEKAAIAAFNEELELEWERVSVPERSVAARCIRQHYPEHQPRLDLLEKEWKHPLPDWWTVLAECPKPEECPGEARYASLGPGWKHPVNKTWCQVCGWRKE